MSSNNTQVIRVLLVEDEDFDVARVRKTVSLSTTRILVEDVVSNGKSALDRIREHPDFYDVVILDYQISGGLRGEELIQKMKELDPFLQIVVITKMTINTTDFDFANNLLKAGAYWYCTKYPGNIEDYVYQPTDFILSIVNASERKKLEKQKLKSDKRLKQSNENLLESKKIIGESKPMLHLDEIIEKYAKSEANVLISGASGTGKELVAWNIHLKSKRKYEKFIPINCGSIPHDLVESELFGYEKGAFTGAMNTKAGLFEIANNGTIFLDEVAELPLQAQVKMLRVIQEGEIEKIGRKESLSVNVRVITATNKNLTTEVNEGRFREDLYYRLAVIPLDIVPLCKRGDDILLLFHHFLDYFSRDIDIQSPTLDPKAKDILMNYKWPGNVRELRNVAQRLVLNCTDKITAKDVTNHMVMKNPISTNEESVIDDMYTRQVLPLPEMEKMFRMRYFKYVRSISSSDSNAAEKLGLAPSNFYRMLKELGLK